jgi:monooxygenase
VTETASDIPPGPGASKTPEHLDVLIVGAGLSGVGAACLLQQECPDKSFAVLEARNAIGGTWDVFRYPGVRSDSDMYTLGYSFRPWADAKAITDGGSILAYIRDTAREFGVDRRVRFGHRVVAADWDHGTARWTVTAERTDTGGRVQLTCSWLSVCSGYFDSANGYRPHLPGEEQFQGIFVHPQQWPEHLDWSGKRVVVIGSGSTAVTLVPSMAERAAHVTMLQRTPGYIFSIPSADRLAVQLQRLLPSPLASRVIRWKNILLTAAFYRFARRRPEAMKALIRRGLLRALPHGFDVDANFTPPYNPWDQRMCFVPDGDFFKALSAGSAEVVTGHIDTFTPHGIRLQSGRELPADIVVTATGLRVLPVGGMRITVGGEPVQLGDTVSYKGMMLSGVPNFNMVIGYTNASWTLKADLVNRYVIRLLKHLDRHGFDRATPQPPTEPAGQPFLDLQSGYVQRGLGLLPTQGRRPPWRLYQNYLRDLVLMRLGRLQDEGMVFGSGRPGMDGPEVAGPEVAGRARRGNVGNREVPGAEVRSAEVPSAEGSPGEIGGGANSGEENSGGDVHEKEATV